MKHRLPRIASAVKDALILTAGNTAGRFVSILALPIATRLYSPEDFSKLAVYVATISTISIAACLRLEIAIPLARSQKEAAELLVLSLVFSLITGITIFIVSTVLSPTIIGLLGLSELEGYVWIVAPAVLLMATYSTFQHWATREKLFSLIAETKLTQSLIGNGVMIAAGLLGLSPFGLILGKILEAASGVFRMGKQSVNGVAALPGRFDCKDLALSLKRYKRFPIFSTPEALLNIAGTQIPVILIAKYEGTEAGYLFLSLQLMMLPMSLIGGSLSQVYLSRVNTYRESNVLRIRTVQIALQLAKYGGAVILVGALLAPTVLPLVFGKEWARSGEIVIWMTPWIILQFVVSPISMSLHALERQDVALLLQILGFLLRVGSISLATHFSLPVIEVFCLSSATFYLIYLGTLITTLVVKDNVAEK